MKLPEEYIVECSNEHESTEVMEKLYAKQTPGEKWGNWKYIVHSKVKYPFDHVNIYQTIKNCPPFPVIVFKEWNKSINEWKLPERWCIKGDEVVENYFKQNNPYGWMYSRVHTYYHSENTKPGYGWVNSNGPHSSHTEITLEQFKKYVLMEDTLQPNEAIVTKDFVKAAHKAACSEWKGKLETQFPQFFIDDFVEQILNEVPDARDFYTRYSRDTIKVIVGDKSKIRIKLPSGNRDWTFRAWDIAKTICNKYDMYPLHNMKPEDKIDGMEVIILIPGC